MSIKKDFRNLSKAGKNIDVSEDMIPKKIAILGNHALQFFSIALKNQLLINGINPNIYEIGYNQIDLELMNSNSKIYQFEPDIIIFFESTLSLKTGFYSMGTDDEKSKLSDIKIEEIQKRLLLLRNFPSQPKVIYYSYELIDDNIYGNYFANVQSSFYNQLFQLNTKLFQLTEEFHYLYIFEINKFLKWFPAQRNWANYTISDVHFTLDQFAYLTFHNAKMISTFTGVFNKCLILDLDNTLWSGVIGDDGIDNIEIGNLGIGKAYTNLQIWIRELKNRGVILAVCSKNDEEIAKQPFIEHREMVLKLDDISVFVANWKNKADNIRYIQDVLNIGFDSIVFLDDNPTERAMIRREIPEITVPDLPDDPVEYLAFLIELNLFDIAAHSKNDQQRTIQYQQEALRKKSIPSLTNMDDYLNSLKMIGEINHFQEADFSRIAQLTQRSNQFNLRTLRYDHDSIKRIALSSEYLTYSIKLRDKFGDYGLISVVILKKLNDNTYEIDTWIMSCRVLKKGVEYFAINSIVKNLKEMNILFLTGRYLPTKKNNPVKNLLHNLGFIKNNDGSFELSTTKFRKISNFIIE